MLIDLLDIIEPVQEVGTAGDLWGDWQATAQLYPLVFKVSSKYPQSIPKVSPKCPNKKCPHYRRKGNM
jgi:hypothetical protein